MVKGVVISIITFFYTVITLIRLFWLLIVFTLFVGFVVWGVERHLSYDWLGLWALSSLYVVLAVMGVLLFRWHFIRTKEIHLWKQQEKREQERLDKVDEILIEVAEKKRLKKKMFGPHPNTLKKSGRSDGVQKKK